MTVPRVPKWKNDIAHLAVAFETEKLVAIDVAQPGKEPRMWIDVDFKGNRIRVFDDELAIRDTRLRRSTRIVDTTTVRFKGRVEKRSA